MFKKNIWGSNVFVVSLQKQQLIIKIVIIKSLTVNGMGYRKCAPYKPNRCTLPH
jgi:hypothetical protein